jgi:DNA replication protein DnaC
VKCKREEQNEEEAKRQTLLFNVSEEAEAFIDKKFSVDITNLNTDTIKAMYEKQNELSKAMNKHLSYFRHDTCVFDGLMDDNEAKEK